MDRCVNLLTSRTEGHVANDFDHAPTWSFHRISFKLPLVVCSLGLCVGPEVDDLEEQTSNVVLDGVNCLGRETIELATYNSDDPLVWRFVRLWVYQVIVEAP